MPSGCERGDGVRASRRRLAGRVRRHSSAVHRADGIHREVWPHRAALLADWNLATATFDWRGQGLADRVATDPNIGHVRRFEDYQMDVEACLKAVRSMKFPDPFHLLAHSMGGCDRPAPR